MQLQVKWAVSQVFAVPQVGDFENVIVRAVYTASATDTKLATCPDDEPGSEPREYPIDALLCGSAKFELDSESEFIPINQLSKETVLGWVKAQLGEDAVLAIEDKVRSQIEAQKNPEPSEILVELP